MATHNILGKIGENTAYKFLINIGYSIIETNWRYKKNEVDIIAKDGEEIVFVEVKTRSSGDFSDAHMAIDWKKIKAIVKTADAYVKYKNIDTPVRFDTICIIENVNSCKIEHIKDAFSSPLS